MGFSIENNYSVLNNYNYNGKSIFSSSVDWLSTPCRRVLGGRNVCVLSQTYEDKMSTTSKIATVFFSVLIFPVAIVSVASLIIKVATFPWAWETKKVKIQSQETWTIINQFKTVVQKQKYHEGIQIFRKQPEIGERKDIYNDFFKAINCEINNHSPWTKVQEALSLLKSNNAIELIKHAVKTKLSFEYQNDCYLTSGSDINDFIQSSLKNSPVESREVCYKELFSNVLQIDVNEDVILNAIKMDIAAHMIRSFIQIKKSRAKNELERLSAKLEKTLLRYSLFKKEQNYNDLYLIFNSNADMQKISAILQNLRQINQISWQSFNKLNALSAQNTNIKDQWNDICSVFGEFRTELDKLISSTDEVEKIYIQSLQVVFDHIMSFINSTQGSVSISLEEIESFQGKVESSLAEQTKNFPNLFADTKVSYFQTNIDNFLSTLRLKKRTNLFTFTEKMKSFLMTYMIQNLLLL